MKTENMQWGRDYFPTNQELSSYYPIELDAAGWPTGQFGADIKDQARGIAAERVEQMRERHRRGAEILKDILIEDGVQSLGGGYEPLTSHMHRTSWSHNLNTQQRRKRYRIAGVPWITIRGSGMLERWPNGTKKVITHGAVRTQ